MLKIFTHAKRWFAIPSPQSLAMRELEDAQRLLLQSQSASEYAKNMATYHEQRIRRLTAYLKDVLAKDES